MSLYFPLPLYEPEEISLSLTSTLTLRHNQIVNRHTDTTLLPYETYYRPDTGGEEVLVEFDIPIKTAQTMEFKFAKGGSMTMTHALRVTMHATLFPSDQTKSAKKIVLSSYDFVVNLQWTVDLPVTIRGRHYVDAPLSPPLSVITSADTSSPEIPRAANKTSETSQVSWIRDRFEIDGSSDEETMPTSAVSGTSSFATTTGYSTSASAEFVSDSESPRRGSELESPQRGVVSPQARRRQLRVVNLEETDMPPQKPAPTGPLPEPPQSATPSPEFRRMSPEQVRPRTGDKSKKKRSAENQSRSARGRDALRSEPQARSRSVPATKETVSFYDPFLTETGSRDHATIPTSEPPSASSVSTKSTMPPTPTAQTTVPSYYHSKPSYYLENAPKISTRARANTTGSGQSPLTPVSPGTQIPSPSTSPQTRVKFTNPEVTEYDSPPSPESSQSGTPASADTMTTKLPFPRSPPEASFPFRPISPPPRRNSAAPGQQTARMFSPPPPTAVSEPRGLISPVTRPPMPSQSRIPVAPGAPPGRQQMPLSPPRLIDSPVQYGQASISLPRVTSPATFPHPSRPAPIPASTSGRSQIPTSKLSPPGAPRVPTARPPLPSQSKARILSMATDTTTSTATRAGTMSTAATSRSGAASAGATVVRPTVKRRPTAPALFPPLPPATLAVHQNRLAQLAQAEAPQSPIPKSPTGPASRAAGRRQSNNWI